MEAERDGSSAAAAAPGAAAASAAANSSLGISLGLSDPSLDELKDMGVSLTTVESRGTKRPKVTHGLFFDDDKGLKKMLRTFHKIRFRGKGHEFEDLQLLMNHYRKWFQELYPAENDFEDMVWKARSVLQEKEKDDDGSVSDPKERLHLLRFQYKSTPELTAEPKSAPASSAAGVQISEEMRKRIEANKQLARERKLRKEQEASGAAGGQVKDINKLAEEDVDFDALWAMEESREKQAQQKPSQVASAFDDEFDPFGFGGGMDDDDGPFRPSPATAKPPMPPPAFAPDEDEDVFGFGGGLDDDDGFSSRPASKPVPQEVRAASETPAASNVKPGLDPELAKRIEANRAKALELKRKKEADAAKAAASTAEPAADIPAAAAAAGAAPPERGGADEDPAASVAVAGGPAFEEEEDIFGFGFGFDEE